MSFVNPNNQQNEIKNLLLFRANEKEKPSLKSKSPQKEQIRVDTIEPIEDQDISTAWINNGKKRLSGSQIQIQSPILSRSNTKESREIKPKDVNLSKNTQCVAIDPKTIPVKKEEDYATKISNPESEFDITAPIDVELSEFGNREGVAAMGANKMECFKRKVSCYPNEILEIKSGLESIMISNSVNKNKVEYKGLFTDTSSPYDKISDSMKIEMHDICITDKGSKNLGNTCDPCNEPDQKHVNSNHQSQLKPSLKTDKESRFNINAIASNKQENKAESKTPMTSDSIGLEREKAEVQAFSLESPKLVIHAKDNEEDLDSSKTKDVKASNEIELVTIRSSSPERVNYPKRQSMIDNEDVKQCLIINYFNEMKTGKREENFFNKNSKVIYTKLQDYYLSKNYDKCKERRPLMQIGCLRVLKNILCCCFMSEKDMKLSEIHQFTLKFFEKKMDALNYFKLLDHFDHIKSISLNYFQKASLEHIKQVNLYNIEEKNKLDKEFRLSNMNEYSTAEVDELMGVVLYYIDFLKNLEGKGDYSVDKALLNQLDPFLKSLIKEYTETS